MEGDRACDACGEIGEDVRYCGVCRYEHCSECADGCEDYEEPSEED